LKAFVRVTEVVLLVVAISWVFVYLNTNVYSQYKPKIEMDIGKSYLDSVSENFISSAANNYDLAALESMMSSELSEEYVGSKVTMTYQVPIIIDEEAWYGDWLKRKKIIVREDQGYERDNEVVTVKVEVENTTNCTKELRLVRKGELVPIHVFNTTYNDGCNSAYISFFTSLSPYEEKEYYLYYSNPEAEEPQYDFEIAHSSCVQIFGTNGNKWDYFDDCDNSPSLVVKGMGYSMQTDDAQPEHLKAGTKNGTQGVCINHNASILNVSIEEYPILKLKLKKDDKADTCIVAYVTNGVSLDKRVIAKANSSDCDTYQSAQNVLSIEDGWYFYTYNLSSLGYSTLDTITFATDLGDGGDHIYVDQMELCKAGISASVGSQENITNRTETFMLAYNFPSNVDKNSILVKTDKGMASRNVIFDWYRVRMTARSSYDIIDSGIGLSATLEVEEGKTVDINSITAFVDGDKVPVDLESYSTNGNKTDVDLTIKTTMIANKGYTIDIYYASNDTNHTANYVNIHRDVDSVTIQKINPEKTTRADVIFYVPGGTNNAVLVYSIGTLYKSSYNSSLMSGEVVTPAEDKEKEGRSPSMTRIIPPNAKLATKVIPLDEGMCEINLYTWRLI